VREKLERVMAAGAVLVGSPVIAIAALAIWAEDGFPVFYRQQRVGKSGRPFQVLKLRSMRNEAGATLTASGDSRVTRVGRILRRYKLDELPQLWNVVRGDMSLIGPRPEVPRFVNLQDPLWQEVLTVKPGITNATTLLYRDEEAILAGVPDTERYYAEEILPRKLALHCEHIRSRSAFFDCKVLALTVYYSLIPAAFNESRARHILFPEVRS
jgi:lipopolysaccharide/colanic/teichoic acid biosynthesis glycosyltransferase